MFLNSVSKSTQIPVNPRIFGNYFQNSPLPRTRSTPGAAGGGILNIISKISFLPTQIRVDFGTGPTGSKKNIVFLPMGTFRNGRNLAGIQKVVLQLFGGQTEFHPCALRRCLFQQRWETTQLRSQRVPV